jgi:hypothetical protein
MTERYRFFDSGVNDTREYTSAEMAELLGKFIRDGVIKGFLENLLVEAQNPVAMGVIANTGGGFVQGRFYKNDADMTLAIPAADATNPRIDRIVVRLDLAADKRTINTVVKAGAPGSAPVAPALQRDATIWELSLAQVYVAAGAVSIGAGNITDERADTGFCGWAVAPDIELHTHDGTAGEGPKIADTGLAAGAATDTVIGERTVDQTIVPEADNTGPLTAVLSWLANMIKAITGKADWKTAPATTLEAASTHIASTANPHNVTATQAGAVPTSDVVTVATANKILKLDANAKLPASITGDANTVDGKNPDTASTADTLALRDLAGDIHARLFRSEYDTTNANIGFVMTQVNTGTDNYMRPSTPAQVKTALGLDSTLKIATGTYTGDGTIPRTISLGFTPKFLFIKNNDSGSVGWTGLGGALRFQKDWGLFADETYGRGFEITTNGVIVGYQNNGETQDDYDTNVSTRVYNYFAIY